ncbi:MarR family transcriptional regulator [Amycolatopsis antarctica]|uniref:MarR family transcriptional regulator n=1 Tax=Amycolatopsis antarctica TaxID=1854586 RepID=A0A263D4C6_9PSEU|nr:MarR family transcriptional regulator [Amycolatopsis antarctica]OZM73313.1 MarR family transcriptional regulator [Amycolatopsis antarctica]
MSPTPQREPDGRDSGAVARFVEDFALVLTTAGMQRMPARVLTALLADQQGSLTASEIAENLRISPAAVSGAVRYLTQVGLVRRGRAPGERRDHYYIGNDVWYEAVGRRDTIYQRLGDILDEGVEAVGQDSPAGERLTETRDFFLYLAKELPALIERWREERAAG